MDQRREALLDDPGDGDAQFSGFEEMLQQAREKFGKHLDTLDDYVAIYTPDAFSADDLINSGLPAQAIVSAYILKLLSPKLGDYRLLKFPLNTNPEWASRIGFDPDETSDRTTFSTRWWERYRPSIRTHIKFESARAAKQAVTYGFDISEEAHNLLDRYARRHLHP